MSRERPLGDHPDAPNLFICGTMRAGTTTLWRALGRHPGIRMSDPKEPHYFSCHGEPPGYRGPGDAQLNARTVWRTDEYLSLFAGPPVPWRGEASAMYLYLVEPLERIATLLPGSRVVAVLRDPVDRAFSAFVYNRQRGREPLADFGAALDAEGERIASGWSPMFHYASASRYARSVRTLAERFPADRRMVLLHDELAADPAGTVRRLLTWLGLEPVPVPVEAVNRAGEPRSPLLAALLGHHPVKRRLKRLLPDAVVRPLERLRERNVRPPPGPPPVPADRLRRDLAADIVETGRILGRDLGRWLP